MPLIHPTVGRVLHFHLNGSRQGIRAAGEPLAALICHVAPTGADGYDRVNLLVLSSMGTAHSVLDVPLVQDDQDPPPEGTPYCTRMPHQISQAGGTPAPPEIRAPPPEIRAPPPEIRAPPQLGGAV